MLLRTAAAGGIAVQVREFSMIQAESAAVVMRAASAPGKLVGEIARAMAGEMIEQLETKRAADGDEDIARDPAGEPPHQMIAGDEAEQQSRPRPRAAASEG